MKTKEQLQAAVDEIRLVCNKHDVALIGTCTVDGGEITIGEAHQSGFIWPNVENVINWNIVVGSIWGTDPDEEFSVTGIGDVRT